MKNIIIKPGDQKAGIFHVNCLNACDTPCNSTMGVVPIGTIFACDSGILPAGAMPLYIRRF